jgi:dolichyl-phosphate beta-glucosyltransferase
MAEEEIYLTIVVSLWNEENRVEKGLEAINKYVHSKPFKCQVIFSDDHSTDRTIEIVKEYAKQIDHLEYLEPQPGQKKGKGAGIQHGIGAAKGKYIMFTDIDMSTPMEDLDKLLPFIEDYDIVMGSRYIQKPTPHQSNYIKAVLHGIKSVIEVLIYGYAKDYTAEGKTGRLRQLISRGGNLAFTLLLNQSYIDQRCGFKLYKANVAKFLASLQTIPGWSFDTEYLAIAQKYHFKIIEVPVSWRAEEEGAKYGMKDAINEFKMIFVILGKKIRGLYSKRHAKRKLGSLYEEYLLSK